jgi:hypothetical protein
MFRSVTFLVYSHTEYDDILEINLKRHQKYFPEMPVTVCTNNKKFIEEKYGDDIERIIEYDAEKPYGEKLAFVLGQIKTPFVIFNQEVNIFHDKVNPKIVDKTIRYMVDNNIDQVRLMLYGNAYPIKDDTMFHVSTGPYFFSVATTLWKTSSFYRLADKYRSVNYRDFENEVQQYTIDTMKNYYLSSSKDITHNPASFLLTHSHHWPQVHTTSYGAWCKFTDYNRKLIDDIASEFGIDLEKRGISW